VVQSKTVKRLWILIHRELKEVLATLEARERKRSDNVVAMHRLARTILTNSRGTSWTRDEGVRPGDPRARPATGARGF
jgi:hypothetical protein